MEAGDAVACAASILFLTIMGCLLFADELAAIIKALRGK